VTWIMIALAAMAATEDGTMVIFAGKMFGY
jgi:hypothetical protein